jgi:hypothetical protein
VARRLENTADPTIARLQATLATWQRHYERLLRDGGSFSEWRWLQFEARHAYIVAQRDVIDLHSGLVSRVKEGECVTGRGRQIQDAHKELDTLRSLVAEIDRICR